MEIVPALLAHSSDEFFSQLQSVKGLAKRIHIDIADGTLVPAKTWADPIAIRDAATEQLEIELHLMVNDPVEAARGWKRVKNVSRCIVHIESPISRMGNTIQTLKKHGKKVRLALNPETPSATLDPYLAACDGVLFMTIAPGAQSNPFVPSVVEKIAAFHHNHPSVAIAADGHVDEATLPMLALAGVTEFCVGSAIFHAEKPAAERYQALQTILEGLTRKQ